MTARLYATDDYLKSIGYPKTIKEMNRADFISFDESAMLLNHLNSMGFELSKANFPMLTLNYIVHWELVKQGLGIGIMPEHIGDQEVLVKQVLPSFNSIKFSIWLTAHREVKTSRRIRMVFDFLVKELA